MHVDSSTQTYAVVQKDGGSSICMNVKRPSGFINRKACAKLCVKAQVSAYTIRSISGRIHGRSAHTNYHL